MLNLPRKTFYQKYGKRLFDFIASLLMLILFSPVFLIISLLILLDSGWPIIFCQKRVGKNGKIFTIFKFRTMLKNAKELKRKYLPLNEANGPVFKIKNDPRFTNFGKKIAHSGLDELPQLVNVLLGQMSFVGPRPLPTDEEKEIRKNFRHLRRSILPGIVSSWVISGAHNLKFNRWLKLDNADIKNVSFSRDLKIILKTGLMMTKNLIKK